METPGNKVATTKKQYQPPLFKKPGLADVLKLLESNPSSHDPAVRMPFGECCFRVFHILIGKQLVRGPETE
jgi:hypothetical protein